MRKKKSIWLLASASMMMLGCTLAEISPTSGVNLIKSTDIAKKATGTGFEKYIGYGYNPARGIPLIDTANALRMNNPILDVNNAEMWANVNVKSDIDSSRQDSMSFTSTSAEQTAEKIGNSISGGITGKVKMVTVNLDTKFDIQRNSITKVQELFSYYSSVIRRRSVVLQASEIQLRKYLNPTFVADAKAIDSDLAANNFITKYGSHLLSGYTLGGILEATNYFSSSSATAAVRTGFDLKSEISASMKAAEAGTSVSFSTTYEEENSSSTSKNHYHFSAFGGDDFPNLTIDDLFAYKGGELSDNKNLMYSIWTDSLNQDKNLAIVEVPDGSRMIGVWELLPDSPEFKAAKPHLINAYVTQCANAVKDANYSDLVQKISLPEAENPSISFKGYEEYRDINGDQKRVLVNYIDRPNSSTSAIVTRPGNIIAFDYDANAFEGDPLEWTLSSASGVAELLDSRNGVIKISKDITEKKNFLVNVNSNGVSVCNPIKVTVDPALVFSGGDGTSDSPYLIANKDDYLKLLSNEGGHYFDSDRHYRLINDLDLSKVQGLKPMGTLSLPFQATFDGDGHTIENFSLDKSNIVDDIADHYGGFIGVLDGGSISNLTLKKPNIVFSLAAEDKDTAPTQLVAAGALVGYSKKNSSIENCKVENPNIDINRGDYAFTYQVFYNASEFYVGGMVGRNEGSINQATVTGGSVQGKIGVNGNRLCGVGGLIGVNGLLAPESVAEQLSNITIDNVTVFAQLREYNFFDYRDTEAGGMIGLAMDLDVRNANVLMNASKVTADNGNQVEDAYAGGLCGYIEDKTNNPSSIDNVAIITSDSCLEVKSNGTSNIGFIAGGVRKLDKLTIKEGGVRIGTSNNSWKAYGSNNFTPSEQDGYRQAKTTNPVRLDDNSSSAEIEINTVEAKTEFVIGESFSAGKIEVTVNGIVTNNYWIDYSAYDKDHAGEYTIKVRYGTEETSYKVYVKAAPISSILVSLKNPFTTRYKDEVVELEDFEFKAMHANGKIEVINPDAANVNIVMDNKSGSKLVEGSNKMGFVITIAGKDFSSSSGTADYVIVNAKGREFKSISWIGDSPSFEAYTNTVMSSSNILKGTSFAVEYTAGGRIEYEFVTNTSLKETAYRSNSTACKSIQLSRNDANVDVIIPSLSIGENQGVICYDDYRELYFTVVGTQDPNDHTAELKALSDLIDVIPTCETMVSRFKAIKAARNYLNSLTWSNAELQALATTLNTYINSYNTAATAINDDIVESIEISAGINGMWFAKNGASVLAIILGILFAI